MFCMNCGQELPAEAKFCLNCGTPQGAVSPTGSANSNSVFADSSHAFVPAMCPNCSSHMKVDSASKIARCNCCGTECLVQEAINTLTVRGKVQVGSAMININGTNTDSLLQRIEMLLSDGDYSGAMQKCDALLDSEPTNGYVYLFMLMSSLGCRKRSDLANQHAQFSNNKYYVKAMQYGDSNLKTELNGYIDAINQRKAAEQELKQKNPKVGDEIYFGNNDGHKIWWKVLSIHNHMALIISSNCICKLPYHKPGGNITWNGCTLRQWLNNEFLMEYFTDYERAKIVKCKLNNENNPVFFTSGGSDTIDRVFLLSIKEANTLFANNAERATGSNWWWLRTPGNSLGNAADVGKDGQIYTSGSFVNYSSGVRPALWLTI